MDGNHGENLTASDYQPWYLGEPNGKDVENCGMSWSNFNAWNDAPCENEVCGFCYLERAPVFTLRGRHTYDTVVHM